MKSIIIIVFLLKVIIVTQSWPKSALIEKEDPMEEISTISTVNVRYLEEPPPLVTPWQIIAFLIHFSAVLALFCCCFYIHFMGLANRD